MARLLLLLPNATYRAAELIAAARRAGAEVVTATDTAQAFSTEHPDRYLRLDFDDVEAAAADIVEFSRRWPLDAVLALDDAALLTAARASERLGLAHSPPGAVAATRDKATMRALLARRGVAQPAYEVVGPDARPGQPEAAAAAGGRLGWPVVVKPAGLSGSRGVIRADDPTGARSAARRALEVARAAGGAGGAEATLLVESFVPGGEMAVDGLLVAGRLRVLAVFDKPDPLDGPFFEETIYVTPSRLEPALLKAAGSLVETACAAMGLLEGPVHAELRVTPAPNRRPVLLEVAARTIGGRCAKALRFAAGRSLEDVVVAHALGDPSAAARPLLAAAAGVMMIPIPRSGHLVAVRGTERARRVPHVTGVEITVAPGSLVRALPEGDRYLGFVFARAATPGLVEQALRDAHRELDIDIGDAAPRIGPAGGLAALEALGR